MTTKPKVELRRVSHSKALSEETPAYSAQVFVDGVHFCDVTNHGQGGPDEVCGVNSERNRDVYPRLEALNARIAATYPKHTYEAGGETHSFDENLEMICHGLVWDADTDKAVKRALNGKVLWLRDGKVYSISLKGKNKRFTREQLVAHVKTKEPNARFLHDMPLTEARKYLVA